MQVKVLTSSRSPGIAGGLTYSTDDPDIRAGSGVRIPLRNKSVEGIVLEVLKSRDEDDFDIKQIQSSLHEHPLLTTAQLSTLQWMSKHYCCNLRQALRVFLPGPPWVALLPQSVVGYRLQVAKEVRGKNQQAVIDYLINYDWASWKDIRTETGTSLQAMNSLLENGIVTRESRLEDICNMKPATFNLQPPKLTDQQRSAYEKIKKSTKPSLLFGITGSGKTEVYAQLIVDVIEDNKAAILLVPEILLTEHCITRFEKLIDREYISVIHSRLTPTQRKQEWKRIRFGSVKLVIGSRSALFAPVQSLGLVVIDEEHEWTYKNEQTPRYHARETAQVLCRESGAKLVLGSATPSIESWHRTKQGIYTLATLPERYGGASLPLVKVIDLANVEFGQDYPFSNTLFEAIERRLDAHEQSVLFLNRRGVATALLCLDCRRRVVSPDSNLPYTVHRGPKNALFLQDHTSGATAEIPTTCPGCGSTRLKSVGAGTQRIEDILSRRFPYARLLRADSDTLTHPEKMRLLLKKMRENQADILLGTQSVVKGLDLPNVTLAAVLLADVGMSLPHFRAGERVFQLLTQLTGRSGRAKPGEVIIQTFRPNAQEVKMAAFHETEEFLDLELKIRLQTGYPPATNMIRLITRGPDAASRSRVLNEVLLKKISDSDLKIGCAPTLFGGGREWHILIRGQNPREVLTDIDLTDVVVDVDPIECV